MPNMHSCKKALKKSPDKKVYDMHYMLNICTYVLKLYVFCIWQWYILYHTFKINSCKITQSAFLILNHSGLDLCKHLCISENYNANNDSLEEHTNMEIIYFLNSTYIKKTSVSPKHDMN